MEKPRSPVELYKSMILFQLTIEGGFVFVAQQSQRETVLLLSLVFGGQFRPGANIAAVARRTGTAHVQADRQEEEEEEKCGLSNGECGLSDGESSLLDRGDG